MPVVPGASEASAGSADLAPLGTEPAVTTARRWIAFREAGHAVAAVGCGVPVEVASIRGGRAFGSIILMALAEVPDLDSFATAEP